MTRKHVILPICLALMVLGLAVTALWSSRTYTSTAILRVAPQQIPQSLVPAGHTGAEHFLPSLLETVLSRGNLVNIVTAYGLYPEQQRHYPMEDIVEDMRSAIRMSSPAPDGSFQISFRYSDPVLAQKVTADLVHRLVLEWTRRSELQAVLTRQFFSDTVSVAAKKWEGRVADLRQAQRTGNGLERARLDEGIARQLYESMSAKLADAEAAVELQRRQQGETLELVRPPSLPSGWQLAWRDTVR